MKRGRKTLHTPERGRYRPLVILPAPRRYIDKVNVLENGVLAVQRTVSGDIKKMYLDTLDILGFPLSSEEDKEDAIDAYKDVYIKLTEGYKSYYYRAKSSYTQFLDDVKSEGYDTSETSQMYRPSLLLTLTLFDFIPSKYKPRNFQAVHDLRVVKLSDPVPYAYTLFIDDLEQEVVKKRTALIEQLRLLHDEAIGDLDIFTDEDADRIKDTYNQQGSTLVTKYVEEYLELQRLYDDALMEIEESEYLVPEELRNRVLLNEDVNTMLSFIPQEYAPME